MSKSKQTTRKNANGNSSLKPAVRTFDALVGTVFCIGNCPWAPGTMGALAGLVVWYVLTLLLTIGAVLNALMMLLAIIVTLISIRPISRLELSWGEDPRRVVIDEVVGVWIALLAVPADGNLWWSLAAFALFRLFDIYKPFGIRRMEQLGGGWGVMMDDVLAGMYSGIVLMIARICLINIA